jgi:uncharacterized membrane protein YraQ (UPF0718 family)
MNHTSDKVMVGEPPVTESYWITAWKNCQTLLLACPALSLPSMIVIALVMGWKKTAVFVSIIVVIATFAGMGYGWLEG